MNKERVGKRKTLSHKLDFLMGVGLGAIGAIFVALFVYILLSLL